MYKILKIPNFLLFAEPSVHFPQKVIHAAASQEDIPEQSSYLGRDHMPMMHWYTL